MSEVISLESRRVPAPAAEVDEIREELAGAVNDAAPFNLFDATCWTGAERPTKDKPRVATDREAALYLAELARRDGLQPFDDFDVVPDHHGRTRLIRGITFGEMIKPAGGEYVEVIDWENITTRREYVRHPAQYEEGAYSVPMPGRDAWREAVTMETLDEAGEVVATSTLPTNGKRQVAWSRDAVRKAAGKVEKPKRQKVKATVPEPAAPAPLSGEYEVSEARYSKGNFVVRCPSDTGYKTRAARLIGDGLNCRWVGRSKGYVASPSKVAKFEALYAAGFDACTMTGKLYHRDRDLEDLTPAQALRLVGGTPEPVEPEKTLSEPETDVEAQSEAGGEPCPVEMAGEMIGEMIRGLMDRVAVLEAAAGSAGIPTDPPSAETEPSPVSVERRDNREARLRIARRYLAMRRQRAEMRAIIADQDRRIDTLAWENGAFAADAEKDVRTREALESELAKVKAQLAEARKPKHPNEPAPDIVAQLHRERAEAAAKVENAERRAAEAERRAHAAADRLEELAGRAIRAEQALQAYRVQALPISFGGMGGARLAYAGMSR